MTIALVSRARRAAERVLDTVPPVRRAVDDLVRVEVVDRSMVIAAQGLLALVPLVVVLAAFLPEAVTELGVERFASVTGVGPASADLVTDQVSVDVATVRTQTGVVGLVVTVLSASSFARAVLRMYERVFDQPHLSGLRGRRLSLGWLLGFLAGIQLLALVGWVGDRTPTALEPLWVAVQTALAVLLWWWTLHVLLDGRVGWRALVVPAVVTGIAVRTYSGCSSLVMTRYARASAEQFGTLGLVLAVATWLVGFAAVLVVCAVLGRVASEDPWLRRLAARAARRRAAPLPPPPAR